MNDSARMKRQTPATTRRRPVSIVSLTATAAAAAAAALMLGACGSPSPSTDLPPSPAPTATQQAEQLTAATPEPTPDAPDTGGNPGPGDGSNQTPPAQPPQIEVTTSSPTASYPCHPSGTIVVTGGGSDPGDSTQLPDSADYPLEVTYQWFIRKAGPEPNPVPIGLPGTLTFNVAGGVPVSGPELDPALHIEVELRVVAPDTISGGWIAHPDCV